MSLVEAEAEAQNGHAGGSEAAALEEVLAEAWRTPVPAGKGETAAVSPVDGTPHRCERCNSKEIEPHGWRYNESEPVQRYRCRACGKRFVFRLGFERMRSPAWAVVDALDLYFKRLSLFEAADFLRRKGISVHPTTVGRWVQKFVSMCVPYLEGLKVLVGDRWHADEIWMGTVGKRMYLFLTMDNRTRFCLSFELGEKKDGHNARALLRNARKRAGKIPLDFVSDALPSYSKAHEAEYAQNNARQPCCTHTRDIHLRNQRDNKHPRAVQRDDQGSREGLKGPQKEGLARATRDDHVLQLLPAPQQHWRHHPGRSGRDKDRRAGSAKKDTCRPRPSANPPGTTGSSRTTCWRRRACWRIRTTRR